MHIMWKVILQCLFVSCVYLCDITMGFVNGSNFLKIDLSSHDHGQIQLWQFEQDLLLSTFTSSSSSIMRKIHFDSSGHRFVATDHLGCVHVWRFDTASKFSRPLTVNIPYG
jgi:WD40 repeat protein